MTISTRELNRLTNERNLFNAQLNVVLPAMHYLLTRLKDAKVPCTKWDANLIESVNAALRARTDEEVETIINAHNGKMLDTLFEKFSESDDAIQKLFEALRGADPAQSADAEEPSDGYGEPGFDDFRDPNTGEDFWPKN